jgi:hypothetical protein
MGSEICEMNRKVDLTTRVETDPASGRAAHPQHRCAAEGSGQMR